MTDAPKNPLSAGVTEHKIIYELRARVAALEKALAAWENWDNGGDFHLLKVARAATAEAKAHIARAALAQVERKS